MRIGNDELEVMKVDLDKREEVIREKVYEGMGELPKADTQSHIVATYFLHAIGKDLREAGEDIASHQTTAIHDAPEGSLVERCTGQVVDVLPFDDAGHVGLVRIAFPTEMMLSNADGRKTIYSNDIMHIVSGAVQHEFKSNNDIKLVDVAMSEEVINMFPGPRYGPEGLREMAGLESGEFMFGTILKPCTGITPTEAAKMVGAAAQNSFFGFVKEDENYHPNVHFSSLRDRVSESVKEMGAAQRLRKKGRIIYAPHISSSPGDFERNLKTAKVEGATAVMFSETYTGGAVRFARDLMEDWPEPLAIYGHNGGIGSKARSIYREVIDMFARLDGIDFRQTGPMGATAYLRPYGLEWEKSEEVLTKPLGKHKAVMVTRAGGLDQGNIIVNLQDIVNRGLNPEHYHFMAGSAINGWKNEKGESDPLGGALAMEQAVKAFYDSEFNNNQERHVERLVEYAESKGLKELRMALKQRYNV